MPDLAPGHFTLVRGPRGGQHRISRGTLTYACSCMGKGSWGSMLMTVPALGRTCRHLIDYRGLVAEATRIRDAGLPGTFYNILLSTLPGRYGNDLNRAVHALPHNSQWVAWAGMPPYTQTTIEYEDNEQPTPILRAEGHTHEPTPTSWDRLMESPLGDD